MHEPDWKVYENYAQKLLDRHQVPGASVGIAVEGQTIYTHGFGWRDVEKKLPVTEDTIFGVGSITKSFTAVAIMQLQEQGKLSVDDPVVRYLPEFKVGKDGAEKHMTIHHFLTHTSGLPPLGSLTRAMVRSLWEDESVMEGEGAEKIRDVEPIDTYEELMAYIGSLDIELLGFPGQYFSYSNDAFALLGAIVERVSGIPYEVYVAEHILKPLGMNRSVFDRRELESLGNVATPYASKRVKGRDRVFAAPVWHEAPAMTAAGFLKSTVQDMLRYMEIYRTGGTGNGQTILSARSIDQMTTPYAQSQPGQYYGYGLMIHPNYHGVSLVEHGGNLKGVSAWVSCIREKGITGVVLTNLVASPGADVLLGAMNTLMGVPVSTKRVRFQKYNCPPERLARYAGQYKSDEGASVKVTARGDGLDLEIEGVHFRARPVGVDTFAMRRKGLDSAVRFLIDTRGEPWGLVTGLRIVRRVRPEAESA